MSPLPPIDHGRNYKSLRLGPRPRLRPTRHNRPLLTIITYHPTKPASPPGSRLPNLLPPFLRPLILLKRRSRRSFTVRPHRRISLPLRMAQKARLLPALPHQRVPQPDRGRVAKAITIQPPPCPSFARNARVRPEIPS